MPESTLQLARVGKLITDKEKGISIPTNLEEDEINGCVEVEGNGNNDQPLDQSDIDEDPTDPDIVRSVGNCKQKKRPASSPEKKFKSKGKPKEKKKHIHSPEKKYETGNDEKKY